LRLFKQGGYEFDVGGFIDRHPVTHDPTLIAPAAFPRSERRHGKAHGGHGRRYAKKASPAPTVSTIVLARAGTGGVVRAAAAVKQPCLPWVMIMAVAIDDLWQVLGQNDFREACFSWTAKRASGPSRQT